DLEAEAKRSDPSDRADTLLIKFPIVEQARRNLPDLLDRSREATALGKSQAIDGAISTGAGNPAEQRIAGDLAGDETRIELEDDFMFRDFPQVIRIGELALEDAQLLRRKSDFREKPRAFAAIVIKNCDRFAGLVAQTTRKKQCAEMIARRHIPLARADENSRALLNRTRKIPARICDRIRRWNESDSLVTTADGPIKIRGLRCRRDAT